MNLKSSIIVSILILGFGLLVFSREKPEAEKVVTNSSASQADLPYQTPATWKLISGDIGEIANTFSWGFNRHICFDQNEDTFWVFYYRLNPNDQRPGWVVYRSTPDYGETWTEELKLTDLERDAADFTIDCQAPYINVAYGDVHQSSIFWKRGQMKAGSIDWQLDSTPMGTEPSYIHVIPSITTFNGVPVISAHDQSEQGKENGHRRGYVVIAKDNEGKEWFEERTVFDREIVKGKSTLAFLSLFTAHDKLYAIVESDGMHLVKYLGKNEWSRPELIPGLVYGGGTPEWATITDNEGNAHIFYPERIVRTIGHAVFDGENWSFETVPSERLHLNQLSASIDENGNIYLVGGDLSVITKKDGQWITVNTSLHDQEFLQQQDIYPSFVNTSQKFINGKLGISWAYGEYTNPTAWFACLEIADDSSDAFLKSCG